MAAVEIRTLLNLLMVLSAVQVISSLKPPLEQFQCKKDETCRYIWSLNSNRWAYCHFGSDKDIISGKCKVHVQTQCKENLEHSYTDPKTGEELYALVSPACGKQPVCPPLDVFPDGYWKCQPEDESPDISRIGPYTSCEPKCICIGGKLKIDFYVRCNEQLQWESSLSQEGLQKPVCLCPERRVQAPSNIRISKAEHGVFEVTVKWDSDKTGIKQFNVKVTDQNTSTVITRVTPHAEINLTDLQPSTEYVLTIIAVDDNGRSSNSSQPFRFRTLDLDELSPQDITAEILSPNTIDVHFTPPVSLLENKHLKGFFISVKDLFTRMSLTVSLNTLNITVSNLTSGANVTISIASLLMDDRPVFADPVLIAIPTFIPEAPSDVRVVPVNQSCIGLSWTTGETQGIIRGYRITGKELDTKTKDTYFTKCDLEANTKYCFAVEPFTNLNTGNKSHKCTMTSAASDSKGSGSGSPDNGWIVPLIIGLGLIVLFIIILCYCCRRNSLQRRDMFEEEVELSSSPRSSETENETSVATGSSKTKTTNLDHQQETESFLTISSSRESEGEPGVEPLLNGNVIVEDEVAVNTENHTIPKEIKIKSFHLLRDEQTLPRESPCRGTAQSFKSDRDFRESNSMKTFKHTNIKVVSEEVNDEGRTNRKDKSLNVKSDKKSEENNQNSEGEKLKEQTVPDPVTQPSHSFVMDKSTTMDKSAKNEPVFKDNEAILQVTNFHEQNSHTMDHSDSSVHSPFVSVYVPEDSHDEQISHHNSAVRDEVDLSYNLDRKVPVLNCHSFDERKHHLDDTSHEECKLNSASKLSISSLYDSPEAEGYCHPGMVKVQELCASKAGGVMEEVPLSVREERIKNRPNMAELCEEASLCAGSTGAKCTLPISEWLESANCHHFIRLCHKLDPDENCSSLRTWRGFASRKLGYDEDRIKAIAHHTRGDVNNGHFMSLVSTMKALGISVGDIVEYFHGRDSRRMDVLDLIFKFHTNCSFCNQYRNPT